ncbi:MAG: N-acetylneuraminate synthase [Tagaea sp. CACIAM 22H2]|nr:N-acetylneuraminate synthase [Tagaea sp. CACIAM 22H2]
MVKFGSRQVGDGQPTFVTYEAGPTHSGLASAKRLIDIAASSGADAIKFQIFDPERSVADRSMLFEYDVLVDRATGRTETVREPLYDLLKRRSLTRGEWRELAAYSATRNLAFFATVGFDDEIDLVVEMGCQSIKIASGDVNHFPLIRKAARTGLCLQLDTGNATLGEVEAAIDVIRGEGNDNIIIHQCPSGYPAKADGINLNIIPTLKRMFPYPVAYSDHSPGWEMDIAAIALGANLVEKTITEDRTTRSVEHVMSLEPQDCRQFVSAIRELERAFGTPRRIMHTAELAKRERVRRSVYLRTAAKSGTKLSALNVEFRRPGSGIGPDIYERLGERTLRIDVPAGHQLSWADLA